MIRGKGKRRALADFFLCRLFVVALAGAVHLAELKPLGHQEGVGGDAQRGVMVKPAPALPAANATGSTPDSAAMPRCLREAAHMASARDGVMGKSPDATWLRSPPISPAKKNVEPGLEPRPEDGAYEQECPAFHPARCCGVGSKNDAWCVRSERADAIDVNGLCERYLSDRFERQVRRQNSAAWWVHSSEQIRVAHIGMPIAEERRPHEDGLRRSAPVVY